MFFESFSDFVDMGGHGLYVWLAYSIGLVVILFNVVSPILHKRKFIAAYKRRLQREQQLSQRRQSESAS